MSSALASEVALLQALLEAEHAAVYGYGVLGARLGDALRARALAADDAHRAARDALVAALHARSAAAPATLAAYDVTTPGPPAALALAVRLEEGLSVRWRDLLGGTSDAGLRALGLAGLVDTAVRAAQWRRSAGTRPTTVALPGTVVGD